MRVLYASAVRFRSGPLPRAHAVPRCWRRVRSDASPSGRTRSDSPRQADVRCVKRTGWKTEPIGLPRCPTAGAEPVLQSSHGPAVAKRHRRAHRRRSRSSPTWTVVKIYCKQAQCTSRRTISLCSADCVLFSASVSKATVADLQAFHRRSYGREVIVSDAAVGAFRAVASRAKAAERFHGRLLILAEARRGVIAELHGSRSIDVVRKAVT